MLLNATNAERDMGALIERVLEYRVCAIVVMNGTPPTRIVKECLSNGVPVILVNKPMPGFAVDTVVTDHAAGGRVAAEQLLAAGCRNLAVVSSGARTASLIGRLASGGRGPPTIRRAARPRCRCSERTQSTARFASPISSLSASSMPLVSIAAAMFRMTCR
jgi:hypothetical protein